MKPYALKRGEGWTYRDSVDFVVKAGELEPPFPRGAAVLEYTATEDEDGHTHRTEDEMFYVLEGAMTFRCGDESFDVDEGGFVFLPCGIRHGYAVRSGAARLLVITSPARSAPAEGWKGFISDIEREREILVARPEAFPG